MKQKKWFGPVLMIALVVLVVPSAVSAISGDDVRTVFNTMNDQLIAMGENIQVSSVEIHTNMNESEEAGQIIYFNDRARQMGSHWVPFDPNRYGVQDTGSGYRQWLYAGRDAGRG